MNKKKALIVEDDLLFAALVNKMLVSTGYEVIGTYAKGEDALQYLSNNIDTAPSLITMDIDLDGAINGIQTTKEIRKISEVPVLFLSARSKENLNAEIQDFSPCSFMNKFITREQFSKAVNSLESVSVA